MTRGIGTENYSAPEVLLRYPVEFKGDIYSLGLILHFMLAKGELPNYKYNIKAGNFKIPKTYSLDIIKLISVLLTKKPELRPSANELLSV